MKIIIPTRGRVGKQITYAGLSPALRKDTFIVCPEREVEYHKANHPQCTVVAQPDPKCLIYQKRRWIMENAKKVFKTDTLVMLDDDLRFCVRREDDPKKFLTATPIQVEMAFNDLAEQLTPQTPHAGFAARGGGISPAAQRGGWQQAKRMMYVLGYHVPTVMKNCDPFRIETREDMDVSLQLLRKGLPNVVNYTFVVDQKFGSPGGASLERDFKRANKDAELLAQLHPGFVRVVQKTDVGRGISEEARTRLEVVVQWQKALLSGQQHGKAASAGRKDRA